VSQPQTVHWGIELALEAAPCAMLVVDQAGRIVLANRLCEQLFGYAPAALSGQSIELLLPEEHRPTHPAYREKYLVAPETRLMGTGRDLYGRRQDGSLVLLEIGLNPVSLAAGEFIVASVVDITERKQAEEALRTSERLQRLLAQVGELAERVPETDELIAAICECVATELGVSRCGYNLVDHATRTVTVTRDYHGALPSLAGEYPFSPYLDTNPDALAGRTVVNEDLASDPRSAETYEALWAPLNLRATLSVPLHREGQLVAMFWVSSHEPRRWTASEIELMKIIAGRVWLAIERKRAQLALEAANEELTVLAGRFRVAINASPTAIFHMDRELRYTWIINRANGTPAEAIVGRTDAELIPPEYAEPLTRLKRQVISTGQGMRTEVLGFLHGCPHWFDLTLEALRDATGTVVGLIGASVDIDEQKRREQRLAELAEENAQLSARLQQALRTHDEFLSATTHDFKNSITGVSMGTQLLRRQLESGGALDPEIAIRLLANIERSTTQMSQMVQDVLDIARAEPGQPLQLACRSTALAPIIENVLAEELTINPDRPIDVAIQADPAELIGFWVGPWLKRVITNLVDNAIKYSPNGARVTVTVAHDEEAEPSVLLTVQDQGIGIPEADLSRIFDRFHRGSNVVNQMYEFRFGWTNL
jgi:PAS domain S-box-containing protein